MITAQLTTLHRETERLHGIIKGISIDNELTDSEILSLHEWIDTHKYLHEIEPFKSVVTMLNRALEDHVIDEDEREEILEWCQTFSDKFTFPRELTPIIRRFHGVLHGIAIDGKITTEEVYSLHDWLNK